MQTKKLKLKELKVNSFVTLLEQNKSKTVEGGDDAISIPCIISAVKLIGKGLVYAGEAYFVARAAYVIGRFFTFDCPKGSEDIANTICVAERARNCEGGSKYFAK